MRYPRILSAVIASTAFSAATPALAYESGSFLIRSGAAIVDPKNSSDDIVIDNPPLGTASGAKVSVASDTQLGLSFTYLFTEHIGLELLAATPFSHEIRGSDLLSNAGTLGETKHLPPTLTAQYYPMAASSKFQPYVGVGINYTMFFDESTTATMQNAGTIDALATLAGAAPGTVTSVNAQSLKLDDSVGVAFQLGADYMITEHLGLNAAVWWIDIGTTGTITSDTNIGAVTAKVNVDIDPMVYMFGAVYKF